MDNKKTLIEMYAEKAEEYRKLGKQELDVGHYDSAKIYFSKALEWLQKAREELNKM